MSPHSKNKIGENGADIQRENLKFTVTKDIKINLIISRPCPDENGKEMYQSHCPDENGKEMYQNVKHTCFTCRAIVFVS